MGGGKNSSSDSASVQPVGQELHVRLARGDIVTFGVTHRLTGLREQWLLRAELEKQSASIITGREQLLVELLDLITCTAYKMTRPDTALDIDVATVRPPKAKAKAAAAVGRQGGAPAATSATDTTTTPLTAAKEALTDAVDCPVEMQITRSPPLKW